MKVMVAFPFSVVVKMEKPLPGGDEKGLRRREAEGLPSAERHPHLSRLRHTASSGRN
jgi:hypothetical protein